MSDCVHIVVKGENLSFIAKQYSLSLAAMIQLNPDVGKNPNLIHPGMAIKLGASIKCTDPQLDKLLFDGKYLYVYHVSDRLPRVKYEATSGLPAHSPSLAKLIKEGRADLKLNTDYRESKYDDVPFAGPIPQTSYYLNLKPQMPYDKSEAKGDGAGWGEGGWRLKELWYNKRFGRDGFFIHHDGGSQGTAGCIGLKHRADLKALQNLLIRASRKQQTKVQVKVNYESSSSK